MQHNKHGPLVVHITLSISVLTVNTVRVYWHSTISILFRYSRLFNNKFQPLLWYHYFTIPKIWMRNALWNEAFPKSQFDPFTVVIFVGANNAVAVEVSMRSFCQCPRLWDHFYTTQMALGSKLALSSMERHNDTYCPAKINISETHRKQTSRGRKIVAGNDFSTHANSVLLHLRRGGKIKYANDKSFHRGFLTFDSSYVR